MNTLYIVDASIYIFRAYYSIPDDMVDGEGNTTNAIYGFTHFIWQLMEQERPSHIAFAFDESLTSSFRNELYPDYKANREPPPPDLLWQMRKCRDMVAALGFNYHSSDRYEADDLIGSMAHIARKKGMPVVIVSRDKDLLQLLRAADHLLDFASNRWIPGDKVKQHFGVHAHQVVDYLALCGDAVDNIPGVPGIGKKTAQALLGHFESLDHLYQCIDEVTDLSLRGVVRVQRLLQEHQQLAYLSRQLALIERQAPMQFRPQHAQWQGPDMESLEALAEALNMGISMPKRFQQLAKECKV